MVVFCLLYIQAVDPSELRNSDASLKARNAVRYLQPSCSSQAAASSSRA
jgi:hypothetical protein